MSMSMHKVDYTGKMLQTRLREGPKKSKNLMSK